MDLTFGVDSMRNKIEFSVNDDITYAPYEKSFAVKILEVDVIPVGRSNKDERIFYTMRVQNITVCATGLCIKESMYYKEE